MSKIYRTKRIEGTTVPGIIHNGSYFMINVDVYEDGMVNCWELVDMHGLKNKLEQGWLVPRIPDEEHLSIFQLGYYKVEKADWLYTPETYYAHIQQTIYQLNPDAANIYTIHERERQLMQQRKIIYAPKAVPFYIENEFGYSTVDGSGFYIFYRGSKQNGLVYLNVYQDGRVDWMHDGQEYISDMDKVQKLFEDGTFFTDCNQPIQIQIDGLATITLSGSASASSADKYVELQEMHTRLQGGKTAMEHCRDCYHAYLEEPSEYKRERLREAYEQIPEHQRMFLGDMDSRDSDYVRIIYDPEDKREV